MFYRTDHLRQKTTFTLCQDYKIHQLYLKEPIKKISRIIGKSAYGTSYRLKKLGLKVPPELAQQRREQSYKKKGDVPFNKGKKQTEYLSPETIERVKKTRFQKGNLPANTYPVGTEVKIIDNYIKVKVAMPNKWMLKHHVIYLKAHPGEKIKPTENIIFIDGDQSNFNPSNLKKVTDTELMALNSMAKLPKEWKRIIKLKNKIKKQLKS